MSSILRLFIDPAADASASDALLTNSIRVEAGAAKNIKPGNQVRVNLTVKNYSSMGRMVRINASFNGSHVGVDIPIRDIYVAPEGSTTVYALIRTYAYVGLSDIVFAVS